MRNSSGNSSYISDYFALFYKYILRFGLFYTFFRFSLFCNKTRDFNDRRTKKRETFPGSADHPDSASKFFQCSLYRYAPLSFPFFEHNIFGLVCWSNQFITVVIGIIWYPADVYMEIRYHVVELFILKDKILRVGIDFQIRL